MKKVFIIFLFLMIYNITPVSSNSVEKTIYENSDIEDIANSDDGILETMPLYDFDILVQRASSGEKFFNPQTIFEKIINLIFDELKENVYVIITIIILAVIFGLISNAQNTYTEGSISETAFFGFYAVYLGVIIKGLSESVSLAASVVSKQVVFMKSAVPVYAALMCSTGNISSASGMEAIFIFFIQLISSVLEKVALPLVFWISVLNMVNCITDRFSIKKLIEFSKQVIKWGVGLLMTFFIGILGLSGFTTSSVDGLGVKTLKFAVGNFVPIVGGMLTESIGTVMSSTIVLKSAIGTVGVITVILMCAMPLIKIMTLMFLYKLSAGLIEPLCDKRITHMISEAGNCMTIVFLIILSVTIMFVLGTTIMLNTGNRFYLV